jgi:hypothetical protein
MKRIAAAPLWFLVGWFVGSVFAWTLGLGSFVAPIVAVTLAGFVVADPLDLIWDRSRAVRTTAIARLATSADTYSS